MKLRVHEDWSPERSYIHVHRRPDKRLAAAAIIMFAQQDEHAQDLANHTFAHDILQRSKDAPDTLSFDRKYAPTVLHAIAEYRSQELNRHPLLLRRATTLADEIASAANLEMRNLASRQQGGVE